MEKKEVSTLVNSSIRVMWGVLCSLSSIDQERNNISLSNIITQINISENDFKKAKESGNKGILVNASHELVIMFRKMLSIGLTSFDFKTDIKISLVDPSGRVIGEMLNTIPFTSTSKNHGHRINLTSFIVSTEGDYEYRVSIFNQESNDFSEIYAIPFTVEKIKA